MMTSYKGLAVALIVALLLGGIYYLTRTKLSVSLRSKLENVQAPLDTLIFDKREAGNIDLERFVALTSTIRGMDSSNMVMSENKDSFSFLKPAVWSEDEFRRMFYSGRVRSNWEDMYKNMPISLFNAPRYGFTAKVDTMHLRSYIYIPYEILFSVARYVHYKNGPVDALPAPRQNELPIKITINETEADQIEQAKKGRLIQTEGIVWKHVSEVIANSGLQTPSKITQLCYLWKFAYQRWIYINDPVQSRLEDTWRSASETIETYYSNDNNKYTGDCDDFAILVASFSRQVGIPSRFVGAFNGQGGHAFAEFFVPDAEWDQTKQDIKSFFPNSTDINFREGQNGKWVNMDWWGDYVGGKYFEGTRKVYDL